MKHKNLNLFVIVWLSFFGANSQNHYVVTSTNDPTNPFNTVSGELRYAINQANSNPGLDYIDFNISGIAPHVITLNSLLPYFTDQIIIDGNTQPANGYTGSSKRIKLEDATFGFYAALSSNSTIKNIEFRNPSLYNGITIAANPGISLVILNNIIYSDYQPSWGYFTPILLGSNSILKGNIIGTNENFQTGSQYFNWGIENFDGSNNIYGSLIAGEENYFYNSNNTFVNHSAIRIRKGNGNKVLGNIFINNENNIKLDIGSGCLVTNSGNNCKQSPIFSPLLYGSNTLINGTSSPFDFIEIYKSNSTGIDAVQLIGTVSANALGQFNITLGGLNLGDKLIATATDQLDNTSEFTQVRTVYPPFLVQSPSCIGNIPFSVNLSLIPAGGTCFWDFGDGTFGTGQFVNHSYSSSGNYNVILTISPGTQIYNNNVQVNLCQPPQTCSNCIGSFAPDAGEYVLSLWVREDISPLPTTYNNAKVQVSFTGNPTVYTFGTDLAKNKVIDGWQRIDEAFTIPATATHVNINLINDATTGGNDAYFDDIRIVPKDGQMKSYVYDPITFKLSAVLDENNYASFYEYDEEGKLLRVKKETEKGIMTIQENRESLKKR